MQEPTSQMMHESASQPTEIAGIPLLDLEREEPRVNLGARIIGAARAAAAIHQSQASRLYALRTEIEAA